MQDVQKLNFPLEYTELTQIEEFLTSRKDSLKGKGEFAEERRKYLDEVIINNYFVFVKNWQTLDLKNITNKQAFVSQLNKNIESFFEKLQNEEIIITDEKELRNELKVIVSNAESSFQDQTNIETAHRDTTSQQPVSEEDVIVTPINTSKYFDVLGFILSVVGLFILLFLFYKYFNKPKQTKNEKTFVQFENINELKNQIEILKNQISTYNGNTTEIQKLKSQQNELMNLFSQLTANNELTEVKSMLKSIVNQLNTKSDSKDVSQIKEQLNLLSGKIKNTPDNYELSNLKNEINKLVQTTPAAVNKTEFEQLKNQINEVVNKINENDLKQMELKLFERLNEQVLSLFSQIKSTESFTTDNENKKNKIETEVPLTNRKIDFYFPIPDIKGFFWKDHAILRPDSESYYAISYKNTNQDSAYFRIMETKISTALKDADICLKPVCEDINKSFSGYSLNIKAEGELKLNGNKWELVKKCKIQVF